MRKVVSGFWLIAAVGFLGFLLSVQDSQAGSNKDSGKGMFNGLGYDATNFGIAADGQPDAIHDLPGADRTQDRVPDGAPDRGGTDGNGLGNGVPDCGDGPGDDQCGRGVGQGPGDGRSDFFGPGDNNDDRIPDSGQFSPINRMHDVNDRDSSGPNGQRSSSSDGDRVAEQPNSDRYLHATGGTPATGSEPGEGVADRTVFDGVRDAVGRDGSHDGTDAATDRVGEDRGGRDQTPDGVGDRTGGDGTPSRANRDNVRDSSADAGDAVPDGTADKGQTRDRGDHNRTQASREITALFGPGDHVRDHASDQGGLGTTVTYVAPSVCPPDCEGAVGPAGAEGDKGQLCSFNPNAKVTPADAAIFLLILLSPPMLAKLLRKGSFMKRTLWWKLGQGLGLLLVIGLAGYLLSAQDSLASSNKNTGNGMFDGLGYDATNFGIAGDGQHDGIGDRPGADRTQDRSPDTTPDSDTDGAGSGKTGGGVPDCYNGPGDGACGNGIGGGSGNSPGPGEGITDYFGPGDNDSDNIPDSGQFSPINRMHDNNATSNNGPQNARSSGDGDRVGEQPNSDRYLLANGLTPAPGSEVGEGVSDRTVFDGDRDAVGRDRPNHDGTDAATDRVNADNSGDGSPDRVNRDSVRDSSADAGDAVPDGTADKGQTRDRGEYNRAQASREITALFGPGDHVRDHASDEGGLGTTVTYTAPVCPPDCQQESPGAPGPEGSAGSDACSFSPNAKVSLKNAVASVLILFLPLLLVQLRRGGSFMKRFVRLGLGLALVVGLTGYFLSVQESGATQGNTGGQGKSRGLGFDPANFGVAVDGQPDDLNDHPGADRVKDRDPDGVDDRGGGEGGDGNGNGKPDCLNGPGDDNCGNGIGGGSGNSPGPGDGVTDFFGPGDSDNDGTPDRSQFSPINRMHDESNASGNGDGVAEQPHSDNYLLSNGLTPALGSEAGEGVPDRTVFDNDRDAVGRDRLGTRDCANPDPGECDGRTGNPDRVGVKDCADLGECDGFGERAVNQDGHPDGTQDRKGFRDRSMFNRAQPSRDTSGDVGPGDKRRDHAADEGGLGTTAAYVAPTCPPDCTGAGPTGPAGSKGNSFGCSFSPTGEVKPYTALTYLLILLAPLALIGLRRRVRR